jgi:hypothetical protein
MSRTIPFSKLLDARVAFVSALASQTHAIHELHNWRLPSEAYDDVRERRLREFVAANPDVIAFYSTPDGTVKELRRSDALGAQPIASPPTNIPNQRDPDRHFDRSWFGLSRKHVSDLAGPKRETAAVEWVLRWKLSEAPWLRDWARFALLWWDLCRSCTVPNCSRGCAAADGADLRRALDLVLSPDVLRDLEHADGSEWSLSLAERQRGSSKEFGLILGGGEHLPAGFTPVVHPLMGPHPSLETEQEFFERAKQAWREAIAELQRTGVVISSPRKLELHCEWLVRRLICRHTAVQILGSDDSDPSTVY